MSGKLNWIDADIHVFEPASMWSYVDAQFRDRIQILHVLPDEHAAWREGVYDIYVDGYGIPGTVRKRDDRLKGVQQVLAKRFGKPGVGWEQQRYLEDVDAMGFDKVVIYPSMFLWAPWMSRIETKFSVALANAYNRWIEDFCSIAPKRLRPVACLSLHSVDAAIAEAKRCAARGFVGAFIRPNPLFGRTIGHPEYHPLYKVLEDLDWPLGVHEGGMTDIPILGEDRTRKQWGIHAMSHAFEQMAAVIAMLENGVFDLFPKLRVLFLEAGSSLWVPYWMSRLDEEMELTYRATTTMKLKPSEYFERQCFATFEAGDPFIKQAIECMGDRRFMMTSDYPHPESSFTNTHGKMTERGLTAEQIERVCASNARAAYPAL